jgi:hypothetical protein
MTEYNITYSAKMAAGFLYAGVFLLGLSRVGRERVMPFLSTLFYPCQTSRARSARRRSSLSLSHWHSDCALPSSFPAQARLVALSLGVFVGVKDAKLRSLHIHIASLFFADRASFVRFITVCSYVNSFVSSVSLASSSRATGGPGVVMSLCGRVYFTCKTRMEGGRSVTCTTCFDLPSYPIPQLDCFRSVVILS